MENYSAAVSSHSRGTLLQTSDLLVIKEHIEQNILAVHELARILAPLDLRTEW